MVKKTIYVALVIAVVCAAIACQRAGGNQGAVSDTSGDKEDYSRTITSKDKPLFFDSFFKPDYTPYKSETDTQRDKPKSGVQKTSRNITKANNPPYEQKEIDKYLIAYKTKTSDRPPVQAATEKETVSKEPFVISDWGPQGRLPSDVRFPSFYVLFSEPVVPIAALGEVSDKSPYMNVTPPLKGAFRWNGTSLLSFDASETANPLEQYTITVSPDVKSINGKTLEGEKSFSTVAEELRITWDSPGYKKGGWRDSSDVPPEYAHDWRVMFNYPVNALDIASLSVMETEDSVPVHFSVEQELINTVSYIIQDDIPENTAVFLKVMAAKDPSCDEYTSASFHTLRPFSYRDYWTDNTHGKYTNPVRIRFSHPVDEKSAVNAISASLDMSVTAENIEVQGNYVTVYGLPVTFKSTYTIKISDEMRDIYGRKLSNSETLKIEVPDAASYASFINYGPKMLEAQFPPKYIFEYQNVLQGSAYSVQKTGKPFDTWNNPLESIVSEGKKTQMSATELQVLPKNERIFNVIDLLPYLNSEGKGIIRFDAAVKVPYRYSRSDNDTATITNTATVQVTDLGITARYGANKIIALVTSLSTGEPVAGASVYAHGYEREFDIDEKLTDEKAALYAETDKDGVAAIEIPMQEGQELFESYDRIILAAEYKGDRAVYVPESHSSWRDGVYPESIEGTYKNHPRIFMFSDRGLYKPGETISFRGIDRDQYLGYFIPFAGSYTVKLTSQRWDDDTVYAEQNGITSGSGGFYGSMALPDDIVPGMYCIEYRRDDDSAMEQLYINVAYFERLKFQTSLSMPSVPVIAGEKIQAELSASYLAGGALSDAEYESFWFREPWYFAADDLNLKDYRFGPINTSENNMIVRSDNGSLDVSGDAHLACETTGASIKGSPYRYRVSADITDASNQKISASGSVVVHPASFYIGLTRPDDMASFPTKGTELAFKYALVSPDGMAVSSLSSPMRALRSLAGDNKKIAVKLTREEWNLVQQQGVSYNVYSRYEKTDITESETSVDISPEGKITVTPLEAGYHTLHLSSSDSSGRSVITEYGFYVTGSGMVSWYQDNASSINLTPDKSQYNPGDTAHILMQSALPKGRYLVTVEREGIFTEEVKDFDGNMFVIDIPIARNYVPVIYVSVSSYSVRNGPPKHEYGEFDLDKPKGYYGVAALFVNPRVKTFSLQIDSAKLSYKPGEEAEITLKASKGGKALSETEVTLMAVDRGVLDLIDYHVPDPIEYFYNRYNFPLRVNGGDSRAMLMDPVTYATKNLAGGDAASEGGEKIQERRDFNPTAVFEPALVTDKNGKVTCRFKLPDSLTTYRITAFGVNGELLALSEDEIVVQNPVNVQQILPRRLRVRDTSELGVLLTNLDSKAHNITVALEMHSPDEKDIKSENGVVRAAGHASVDGKKSYTVNVPEGSNSTVYFNAAAQKAGVVDAVFTIKSDIINERLVCPLTIEKPYIYETFATTGTLAESESERKELVVLPSFADIDQSSFSVTLDATRLGPLGTAVQYVFDYPYGCMEQQSARVLPLVIFGDYIDVFGLDSKVQDVRGCVIQHFASWKNYQMKNGGFGYWPNSYYDDKYVSARIAHIWALALKSGYTEAELSIDGNKLGDYIQSSAGSGKIDEYTRAYMYYVLSLLGRKVDNSSLEALLENKSNDLSVIALAGLASFAKDGANSDIAKRCGAKIRTYMRPTTRGVDISKPNAAPYVYSYYNNDVEILALTLQLFVQMNKDDDMNSRLLFTLLKTQQNGYWKNTATTARVLDSIRTLIECCNVNATDLTASAVFNGKKISDGTFKGAAAKPATKKLLFSDALLLREPRDSELPLLFKKSGSGSLYYTAILRYTIPEEMQTSRDMGLGVSAAVYDNTTGEEITGSPASTVLELESGKTYRVKITLSSTYDREFIALRAPIPSGAEILDASFDTSPYDAHNASGEGYYSPDFDEYEGYFYGGSHWMSNQEIYDNEVRFFWDYFAKGKTTAEFKFRTARRGVFPTPPVNTECMYEPEIFGRTNGVLYIIK